MSFTSQLLHLERLIQMVDFSNKWYRETCIENGLNPDNILSQSAIAVAKQCAIDMKMYIDKKEQYEDEEVRTRLDEQINRLNNERIECMLYALTYAEIMNGVGAGADKFIETMIKRQELARR